MSVDKALTTAMVMTTAPYVYSYEDGDGYGYGSTCEVNGYNKWCQMEMGSSSSNHNSGRIHSSRCSGTVFVDGSEMDKTKATIKSIKLGDTHNNSNTFLVNAY